MKIKPINHFIKINIIPVLVVVDNYRYTMVTSSFSSCFFEKPVSTSADLWGLITHAPCVLQMLRKCLFCNTDHLMFLKEQNETLLCYQSLELVCRLWSWLLSRSVGCWGSPVMLVKGQWELELTGSLEAGPTKEQLRIINGAGCQVINTVCLRQDAVRLIHCAAHRLLLYNSPMRAVRCSQWQNIWQKQQTLRFIYYIFYSSSLQKKQKSTEKNYLFIFIFFRFGRDWQLTYQRNYNNIKIIQQLWLDANTVRATN